VIVHMIGNLQVFLGPEALDHYGVFLRELLHGGGLWIARAVLLACVVLHVWAATALTLGSWKARPTGYRRFQPRESTYASRTMRWGGPLIAAFIVYHLMHLTVGNAHPQFEEGRVYHNVITGFQVLPVSLFYIVAQVALGFHLYHGGWSLLQTLGLSHPRWNPLRFAASLAFTLLVAGGNILIPVAVLAGWVR
jgi:succinate dehydrogenase / fumarate reductase cytochrome b subunit